jgi:hypothetical protein
VRQDRLLGALNRFAETVPRHVLRLLRTLDGNDHPLKDREHQLEELKQDGRSRAPLSTTKARQQLVLVRLQGDIHPRIDRRHRLTSWRKETLRRKCNTYAEVRQAMGSNTIQREAARERRQRTSRDA